MSNTCLKFGAALLLGAALFGCATNSGDLADNQALPFETPDDEPIVCEERLGDCNGDRSDDCEVSLSDHAQHCGACGLSCGGGSCVDGQCQPYAVTEITAAPSDLTTANGIAYFSDSWDGTIQQVALVPGAQRSYFDFGAYAYPEHLASTSDSLFFSTAYDGSGGVFAVPFAGGGPATQLTTGYQYSGIAAQGDHVVFVDAYQGSTRFVSLSTPGVETTIVDEVVKVASNASHVAFRQNQTIVLYSFELHSSASISTPHQSTSHPTIDDEHVYWVEQGRLLRWTIATGALTELSNALGPVESVEVSSDRVLIATVDHGLWAAPIDGGPAHSISSSPKLLHAGTDGATWISDQHLMHLPTPFVGDAAQARCSEVFRDCNGVEADRCETSVWSDPNHCGGCGNVCDGLCVAGTCRPKLIATNLYASSLVVANGELYAAGDHGDPYTDGSRDVFRLDTEGQAGPAALGTDIGYGGQLATNGTDLFYSNDEDNVYRRSIATGTAQLLTDTYGVQNLAVDGNTLYWNDWSGIHRVATNGGIATALWTSSDLNAFSQSNFRTFAFGGGQTFLSTGGSYASGRVLRGVGGGQLSTVYNDNYNAVYTMQADAEQVYIGHEIEAGLVVVAHNGSLVRTWLPGTGVNSIVQDATHVYWFAGYYSNGYTTYQLVRAEKHSDTVEVLANAQPGPIALGANHVYFGSENNVLRIPKTGLGLE